MKVTEQLHDLGQSLWLDGIRRGLVNCGTLETYINEFSITGLTSNPDIFDHAVRNTTFYDDAIRGRQEKPEALFFELAIEDLARAADLFLPIHHATNGEDGWVSLEVSPLLAYDPVRTLVAARELVDSARRENLFIRIPGTWHGLKAIGNAIFDGIPVNVTLLFSAGHYLQAARAYMRAIRRRISRLDPAVRSVASIFVSRWDKAVMGRARGIQRSAGDCDCRADVSGLSGVTGLPQMAGFGGRRSRPAALALCEHGDERSSGFRHALHRRAGGSGRGQHDARSYRASIRGLQREGADGFVDVWKDLMSCIETKARAVAVGAGV